MHSYTRKIEISIALEILRYFALVQTSGNISLIAERDDSGHRTVHAWYQAMPLFWYARLEWWDRKYQDYLLERSHIRRDANNRANSQIIARCIAICSAMLITIISEIFMFTLVKISRFRPWCKTEICILLIPASVNAPISTLPSCTSVLKITDFKCSWPLYLTVCKFKCVRMKCYHKCFENIHVNVFVALVFGTNCK